MKVITSIPFSLEKNLGKAYNEIMQSIGDDDFACLTDQDILFLTPDSGNILHGYAERFPDAGVLTCLTNRVSTLSHLQLLRGVVDENSDIRYHIPLAENQRKYLWQATQIERDISGFLMLIPKKSWNICKFSEDKKCLGVDTEWNRRLRMSGKKIIRMDGLYVFHIYRLMNGIHHKQHLL